MTNLNVYAAVQNGVILDTFDSIEEARSCIQEEIKKDWLAIMFTKKLRKLFKKNGNVPMHSYSILHIVHAEEVKA